jgi:hypothetical protein
MGGGAQNYGASLSRTGGPGSHRNSSSFLREEPHLKLRASATTFFGPKMALRMSVLKKVANLENSAAEASF